MNISSSLRAIMDHPSTTRLITGLILLNAVTLGLETHDGLVAQHGALLERTAHAVE